MNTATSIISSQRIEEDIEVEGLEKLTLLRVDHKNTSLNQVGLLSGFVNDAYRILYPLTSGIVVISTCNRFEIYLDRPASRKEAIEAFTKLTGLTPSIDTGLDTVRHLFRVASGIESRILGENEILGQVRDAWTFARDHSYSSSLLDSVFMYALKIGRRVREETGISEGVIGYPKAAVIASLRRIESLEGKDVIVLGAGKAGRIIAGEVCKLGPRNIFIANRSPAKAFFLSNICQIAKPVSLTDIPSHFYDVAYIAVSDKPDDKVIASIISSSDLIVDISIPPIVSGDNIINVFQVEEIVEEGVAGRRKWIPVVENIVEEEIFKLASRLKSRNADVAISTVNHAIETIIREEMNWINNKIPREYQEYARLALNASLKKMAHPLIIGLRELARLDDNKALRVILEQYSRV